MGRKRQVLIDTDGRGLTIKVQAGCIQDRDGAAAVLVGSRSRFPFIERAFADAGYVGERVNKASRIVVEIIRKAPDQIGFAVQPRRWVADAADELRSVADGVLVVPALRAPPDVPHHPRRHADVGP